VGRRVDPAGIPLTMVMARVASSRPQALRYGRRRRESGTPGPTMPSMGGLVSQSGLGRTVRGADRRSREQRGIPGIADGDHFHAERLPFFRAARRHPRAARLAMVCATDPETGASSSSRSRGHVLRGAESLYELDCFAVSQSSDHMEGEPVGARLPSLDRTKLWETREFRAVI